MDMAPVRYFLWGDTGGGIGLGDLVGDFCFGAVLPS